MKKILSILSVVFTVGAASAGTIVIEGKYQQQNLFVVNSISGSGVGFCAYEVTVNGEITTDETNSAAFEIDLSVYGFKPGDNVIVIIKHKDGCEPRVLNMDVLEPKPTFETVAIDLTPDEMLSWETRNEQGEIPFIIQHFKWNKWVNVGEVKGNGTSVKNKYSFKVNLVAGENKFRVIQRTSGGREKKTPTVQVESKQIPIDFSYDKNEKSIKFTGDTGYEVYNEYGQIFKRGSGKWVDMSNAAKGEYYVSFDNRTEKFSKK